MGRSYSISYSPDAAFVASSDSAAVTLRPAAGPGDDCTYEPGGVLDGTGVAYPTFAKRFRHVLQGMLGRRS